MKLLVIGLFHVVPLWVFESRTQLPWVMSFLFYLNCFLWYEKACDRFHAHIKYSIKWNTFHDLKREPKYLLHQWRVLPPPELPWEAQSKRLKDQRHRGPGEARFSNKDTVSQIHVRYHFAPSRMAILKKDYKLEQWCGNIRTPTHHCYERKRYASLEHWQSPSRVTMWPISFTPLEIKIVVHAKTCPVIVMQLY